MAPPVSRQNPKQELMSARRASRPRSGRFASFYKTRDYYYYSMSDLGKILLKSIQNYKILFEKWWYLNTNTKYFQNLVKYNLIMQVFCISNTYFENTNTTQVCSMSKNFPDFLDFVKIIEFPSISESGY